MEGKTMMRKHGPSGACGFPRLCGRTLFVVDIENMVGSHDLSQGDVSKAQRRINRAVEAFEGDHTVIAASHHNALAMFYGWAGSAQRLTRSGPDGADRALLESVADIQWVAERYQSVVVASGDHAFAFAVAALKAAGVAVIVIRPDLGFSPAMARAAAADVVSLGSALPANVINLFSQSKDAA